MKPVFIDNRDGNYLHKAITGYLKALRENVIASEELCISSAYFNPQGLDLLSEEAQHVGHIRLLLGVEPTPEAQVNKRSPFDPPEPTFTRQRIQKSLLQMDKAFRTDRDLLPFNLHTNQAICHLLEFLKSGKIEVRRYEKQFLHAKAFIFRGVERGVLSGSSNLTRAGLQTNLELNLGNYDDPLVGKIEAWFDELWEEAVPLDLSAIYEELQVEYPPYLIFLKVLWHLYGEELEKEEEESGHIPVTTFQKHGVWRAKRILKKYGGVIVADGVGLGKTFTAGDIIRAYRDQRQRVLLIRPAALKHSWDKFLNSYQLLVECVSFEQLFLDAQLGGESHHLKNPLEDYALVVIDEAHNYRNPDSPARAGVLRRLLSGKRRDLLMLTATPVNNSLWDLYHLLRFFQKQDAILADKGVISIRERFRDAMRIDPFNLNPDMLYPIIDATTVKRTRRFVKKHYTNDMIKGFGGDLLPIRFPKPVASTIKYNLDEVLPGFFARVAEILMPEDGHPQLTLARYMPENYPVGEKPQVGDSSLVGLLRSGLLKRFESSAFAFHKSLQRMIHEHEIFLEALDQGKIIQKDFLKEFSAAEDDTDLNELLKTSEHIEDGAEYNIKALKANVKADIELLRELASEASSVRAENSPKLAALIKELIKIINEARSDALDEEEEHQRRKVLIFSFFEHTIDWIEEHLIKAIEEVPELECYIGRIASVSGKELRNGIHRDKAVYGFAPISSEAPPGGDEDKYDILLCTDVLAEGMNLQQCRNIINFDLPWNPMRLIQRHGRVDRIGSPFQKVFLRTFFPDEQLDDLLNLEERVRRKLAHAAASVGVEDAPIVEGLTGEQSFAETREEIEKLYEQDNSIFEDGGTSSAAQTGEEYRQELRVALKKWGNKIQSLPWKAGSGIVSEKGNGHFFCAQVGDRIYLRFVPLGAKKEEIIKEIGTCLRLIECEEKTVRKVSQELAETAFDAWKLALENIFDEWTIETDPANLQPKVPKLNREVAQFIRDNPIPDIPSERFHKALDAVETPWSRREENQLRSIFKEDFDSPLEKSKMLVEEIEKIGIEPFHAPDPLPPINLDDVHLICWMALESKEQ